MDSTYKGILTTEIEIKHWLQILTGPRSENARKQKKKSFAAYGQGSVTKRAVVFSFS